MIALGTRGAWGFYRDGVTKAAYSQYDSYPTGLGASFVEVIANLDLKTLNRIFDAIVLVDGSGCPKPQLFQEYSAFWDRSVSTGRDWYSLLRKAQDPKIAIPAYRSGRLRHMIDSSEFLKNSLYCEWAYIANLTEGIFEVYMGFQEQPQSNRYYTDKPVYVNYPYYNVALLRAFPLYSIPRNWAEELEQLEYA